MNMSTPVIVVDDDEAVRDSLAALLRDAGHPVSIFPDAESLLDQIGDLPFGPLVTDVRMPGLSGIDLIRRLHEVGQAARPVIVITGHADVPLAVEAMRAGARDFLEKPFEPEALLLAVKAAAGVTEHGAAGAFTARERQVSAGLARGLTSKQIAMEMGISYRTVEVFRARLLKKAGVSNTAALVALIRAAPRRP